MAHKQRDERKKSLHRQRHETSFRPVLAATLILDGNQTRIKTVTGIWTATYNALNRPVRFEKADGSVVITADYDYMGRRVFKKVETNNAVSSHLRFLYRGYLQIANLGQHTFVLRMKGNVF